MNAILMKQRPKDMSKEKFEEMWRNSRHVFDPLVAALKEMQKGCGTVAPTDFDTPNHYAKLVAELVKKQTLEDIIALFPE